MCASSPGSMKQGIGQCRARETRSLSRISRTVQSVCHMPRYAPVHATRQDSPCTCHTPRYAPVNGHTPRYAHACASLLLSFCHAHAPCMLACKHYCEYVYVHAPCMLACVHHCEYVYVCALCVHACTHSCERVPMSSLPSTVVSKFLCAYHVCVRACALVRQGMHRVDLR